MCIRDSPECINCNNDLYRIGARYGLNTETANFNPTFTIDKTAGVINFDSTMANQQCVLQYISDGMENGDVSNLSVNKLFEEYIYAYIKYSIYFFYRIIFTLHIHLISSNLL